MAAFPRPSRFALKVTGLAILAVIVVSIPFMIWGEDYVQPLMESQANRKALLVLLAIGLLAADSVAPVPATLVIMFLAAKAGWVAGIVGGTLGMCAGVLAAAWVGRTAVGRVAPKFFPEDELNRLRQGLQGNLALTLACWRSVPVIAETSVILAAAAGVPIGRIFRVTILPNFVICVVYSLAADDSFSTACLAFTAVVAGSFLLWRLFAKR